MMIFCLFSRKIVDKATPYLTGESSEGRRIGNQRNYNTQASSGSMQYGNEQRQQHQQGPVVVYSHSDRQSHTASGTPSNQGSIIFSRDLRPTTFDGSSNANNQGPIIFSSGQRQTAHPPVRTRSNNPSRSAPRYYFLDNLKIFLTGLVVTHHVTCAFGGCGEGSWYLSIGNYLCVFTGFARVFAMLNQGYFMTLFFLISGFFIPSSYDRKGPVVFLLDKIKRLIIPAMVCSFTINPLALILSQLAAGESVIYFPNLGPCWYLSWLFILCFAYCTLRVKDEPSAEDQPEEDENREPSGEDQPEAGEHEKKGNKNKVSNVVDTKTINEWFWASSITVRFVFYGLGLCGFCMAIMVVTSGGQPFFGMPITIGSFFNDIVMFVAGVTAKRNGHFDRSITEQLGVPLFHFRCILVIEVVTMIGLGIATLWAGDVFFSLALVAGPYCIDMDLSFLQIFQANYDTISFSSRLLAKASYTVYLVHPLIVVGVTWAYIEVYNMTSFLGENQIKFDGSTFSDTEISSRDLVIGWVIVTVVSHLICWPLGMIISALPGMKHYL